MLQSSLLQFHNPTHRNTGVSDPHSNHIARRAVVWGIFGHGLCIRNAKSNKELLKTLHFYSRGVGQFLGEQGNTDWQRHADPSASNRQGQRVSSHIHHRICILTRDTYHILWLHEWTQLIKYVCLAMQLSFEGCISQNGAHFGTANVKLCDPMEKMDGSHVVLVFVENLNPFLLPGKWWGLYHKPQ